MVARVGLAAARSSIRSWMAPRRWYELRIHRIEVDSSMMQMWKEEERFDLLTSSMIAKQNILIYL
jgi:hypothetical protein